MKVVLFLISLVLATLILNGYANNQAGVVQFNQISVDNFIIRGTNARRSQFPWQIYIQITSIKRPFVIKTCGGTLITTQHALTAAHCCYDYNQFKLLMGKIVLNTKQFNRITHDCKIHKDYVPKIDHNDIAILHFHAITITSNVRPIALPRGSENHSNFTNSIATVSGWDGRPATYLQYITVRIVENSECRRYNPNIAPKILCAKSNQTQSICEGDSGGPLVYYTNGRPKLIGVASFILGGCLKGMPMGFTRVTEYLSWIQNVTKQV